MRNGSAKKLLLVWCTITALFFTGLVYMFIHSYYLCSYSTVKTFHDPRWRVFDFNSRQATEDEIYSVAEIPSLKHVEFAGDRRLRFEFTTLSRPASWTVFAQSSQKVVSKGQYPEIQFPAQALTETYFFQPESVSFGKDIVIRIDFWPEENYGKAGLSWPDNYWMESVSIPVSLTCPYSIDEWVGLPDTNHELKEARRILGTTVDNTAPTLKKLEQVYRFVMENTRFSHKTPSDEVQTASPLETYTFLNSGEGQGFCENHALIYYLFANAAGIQTRMVDLAGKLGPLKLTGHYFCESWIPEYAVWAYVDPESYTAHIRSSEGVPITTLELKRLIDLDVFEGYTALLYDIEGGGFESLTGGELRDEYKKDWMYPVFRGNVVFGYKFGYGNTGSFSKIRNFLGYITLLYAPFALPKLYLVKYFFLYGFCVCLAAMILMLVVYNMPGLAQRR